MNATAYPPRRATRQQAAVARQLEQQPDFVSAQQLHAQLREDGETVGLATVYRTLQTMTSDGQVDMLRTEDGEAVYRRCSTSHHHHLVCRDCGRTVEIEGQAVEEWTQKVSREHGFSDVDHVVEIVGTCADCRR